MLFFVCQQAESLCESDLQCAGFTFNGVITEVMPNKDHYNKETKGVKGHHTDDLIIKEVIKINPKVCRLSMLINVNYSKIQSHQIRNRGQVYVFGTLSFK